MLPFTGRFIDMRGCPTENAEQARDEKGRFAASDVAHVGTMKASIRHSGIESADRAKEDSIKAKSAANRGDSEGAATEHRKAVVEHTRAAAQFQSRGDNVAASAHKDAATLHQEAAISHESPHDLGTALEGARRAATGTVSQLAHTISHDALLDDTRSAHLGAAGAHKEAAEELKGKGSPLAIKMHELAAKLHKERAKVVGNSFASAILPWKHWET